MVRKGEGREGRSATIKEDGEGVSNMRGGRERGREFGYHYGVKGREFDEHERGKRGSSGTIEGGGEEI